MMPTNPFRCQSEPTDSFRVPTRPGDFPGLICFWDFAHRTTDGHWPVADGTPYALREQAGAMSHVDDAGAPFHGRALGIEEGQWLAINRADCPRLDMHGPTAHFTLVAWIRRGQTRSAHCEFIAGQWNETHKSRQYGLFLNISVWGEHDQICGHLSTTGGPTPGYRYCMDGPVGATPIDRDAWHCIALSYDGHHGYAWLDGRLDARPGLNPYLLPGGLHNGGATGSDFTVAAVDRSGTIGNFYRGLLGGLAIYQRVLNPAEMWALGTPAKPN
ncbi:MAG: LamG-like jellyroll fold domain-containing protein [Phycisphaeraceae bacterium]